MNPQAFQIIEALGMRHPKCYSLGEAIESHRNSFYLRYDKKTGCQSRIVDKEGLIVQKAVLEKDISMGKLLKIEDSFNSIAGCAVYVNPDGIYGEYVCGHIIALLRRGICKKRFLVDENKRVTIKDVFQGFEARQTQGGYIWKPFTNEIDKMDAVIDYLLKNINSVQSDLLLEILITENDIIVCDAKHPTMEDSWQGIKDIFNTNSSEIYLKNGSSSFVKKVKIDGFDIDLSESVKDILICNGAILSHYITRNYVMYNSIKIIV